MSKRYYAVTCKCGHVGRNKYIPITFGIIADSKKKAAEIARNLPRCKHHHKDCVQEVIEIDIIKYKEIRERNNVDSYLNSSCIQEQRMNDISDRIYNEPVVETKKIDRSKNNIYLGKIRIRRPKKFIKSFDYGRYELYHD